MATFDLEQQKIVARIVYDGVAHAGKTTNVKRLGDLFTGVRRSDMVIPEEKNGRTLWFDWVQLEGGMICGLPLSCQIVTVPGQTALGHRRRHLLHTADVVVFVADSSRARTRRTREGLELLRRMLDERGAHRPPLVLQANKQDATDALTPEALLSALALSPSTPTLPARAHQGVGVRETLIRAVRALTDHIQQLSDGVGVQLQVRPAEVAQDLHAAMVEDDFEEEIDITTMEALEELIDAPTVPAVSVPAAVAPAPPPPVLVSPVVPGAAIAPGPPAPAASPAPRLPLLPRADALTGYVWPAMTARDLLRDLEAAETVARAQAPDRVLPAVRDAQGIGCRIGAYWVHASHKRYAEPEEARTELIRLARGKSLIGELQLPGTVLAIQRDEDGGWRLWTLYKVVASLESVLDEGLRQNDEAAVSRVLAHYARIAVDALLLASREHLAVSLSLAHFALVSERTYYIGEDIGFRATLPNLAEALAAPLERAARFPEACAAYVDKLETALRTRVSQVDADRTGLVRSVSDARVSLPARAVLDRLVRVVGRGRPIAAPAAAVR